MAQQMEVLSGLQDKATGELLEGKIPEN